MKKKNKNKTVLMCGSSLSVKGGMVSVIKNYMSYQNWEPYKIIFIPTHIEKNKIAIALFFLWAYIRIFFCLVFRNVKIIHLHTAERGSFYRKALLVRLCKKFGVKTVMHHHGAEFDEFYSSLSDKKKKYVKRILELTDVNIVLSKRLISMVKDKAPEAKVEVLYNAVNTYMDNPYNADSKEVLFLGRLGKRKGVYDLLEAIKILDTDIPIEIKFNLCGDGDISGVKQRIKELEIDDRISHVGWIDFEQKKSIFANTVLNVLPSYNEGLPMTILETMAYGIPNISTAIASIPEVLDNSYNGLLITPGDVQNLAKSIEKLIFDYELRKLLSQRSYELISEKFALRANIESLMKIYQPLIDNN